MEKRIKLPNVGDLVNVHFYDGKSRAKWTVFYVISRERIKNKGVDGKWHCHYYYQFKWMPSCGGTKIHYDSASSDDIQMYIRTKQWKVSYATRKRRSDSLS